MKNRVCRLSLEIKVNEQTKCYALTPLSVEEIGPGFVAGYRVINRSETPQPVYLVRVRENGVLHCTCPAFSFDERKALSPDAPPQQPDPYCKHCEALQAAGAVVRGMLDTLKARTRLLDSAEQRIAQLTKNRDIEREASLRNTDSLRKEMAQLERELHDVRQRAMQLQTSLAAAQPAPRRRTRKATAKAA